MSIEAAQYVQRHVRGLTTAQRAILDQYALLANPGGRIRISQWGVAQIVELSRRQVERHVRVLRELGHLIRQGRTWLVRGVAEHDLRTCEHPWCVKQYQRQCRPRTMRPRRYANPDTWQQLPAQRPPELVDAFTDAAAAADAQPREQRTRWRKFKRGRGRPPP